MWQEEQIYNFRMKTRNLTSNDKTRRGEAAEVISHHSTNIDKRSKWQTNLNATECS